jgi:hypothetical protein
MRLPSTPVVTLAKEIIQYMIVADARQAPDRTRNSCDIDVTMPRGVNGIELAYCIHEFYPARQTVWLLCIIYACCEER